MTSCCGNELIFNSVISEVVSSNLEQASYFINILYESSFTLVAVILIGILIVVLGCRKSVNIKSRSR